MKGNRQMKKKEKKEALGKGLEALFKENIQDISEAPAGQVRQTAITEIEPNKEQPRRLFDNEKLEELVSSISEHGILQPIIVRPIGDRYQIVSGERRWRAARRAGLSEVPVIIREIDDKTCLELSLIENLQRENLNVIEEAKGYQRLAKEFSMTQEIIAQRVGKSRPVIANALRLLSLPEKAIQMTESGELSAGHARALLPLAEKLSPEEFEKLLEDIKNKNITVRELENLYKRLCENPVKEKKERPEKIYYAEIEGEISEKWGRKVRISAAKNKGKIELEFYNKEDFEELIRALKK